MTVAVGYAWNAVFVHGVTELINDYDYYGTRTAIQFIGTCAITRLIVDISARYALFEEAHDIRDSNLRRAGRLWIHNFLAALSYVFGWAISDFLNLFVFSLYFGCKTPLCCSFQANFAYCIALSFLLGWALPFIKEVQEASLQQSYRNNPQLAERAIKTYVDLTTNAAGLIVGYAWAACVHVVIKEGAAVMYGGVSVLGLCIYYSVAMGIMCLLCPHIFKQTQGIRRTVFEPSEQLAIDDNHHPSMMMTMSATTSSSDLSAASNEKVISNKVSCQDVRSRVMTRERNAVGDINGGSVATVGGAVVGGDAISFREDPIDHTVDL